MIPALLQRKPPKYFLQHTLPALLRSSGKRNMLHLWVYLFILVYFFWFRSFPLFSVFMASMGGNTIPWGCLARRVLGHFEPMIIFLGIAFTSFNFFCLFIIFRYFRFAVFIFFFFFSHSRFPSSRIRVHWDGHCV